MRNIRICKKDALFLWIVPDKAGKSGEMLYANSIDGDFYSVYNTVTKIARWFRAGRGTNRMKKYTAWLLTLVLLAAMLTGCAANESIHTGGKTYTNATLDEIKADLQTVNEGKLTMATSPDFAPYEFYAIDENGEAVLAGFDISLAHYIADYLGLELEIIPMDFNGTITELGNKRVDIGMAGYSPDPEREEKMDFSEIYYYSTQSFVCLQSNQGEFKTLADANSPEYSIGVQLSSIQAKLARANVPNADIVELTKVTDVVAELLSGKLDGAFIETPVAESYAANYPELCILHPVPYDEAAGSVIGVYKGNGALLAGVNMAIEAAMEDGSFDLFVAEANELAAGETYEGLLEEDQAAMDGLLSVRGFEKAFQYLNLFKEGLICTVSLSVLTVLFGFLLALVLALCRMGKSKLLKGLACVYVEIFRATPMLVQLFIVYHILLGGLNLPTFKLFGFIRFERFLPGVIALSLNSAAYLSEIIRSGIQSIDGGQSEAARSLGMNRRQTMVYIVLPQAIKNILPAIANEFVTIIKESSICYTIGVQEIMSAVNSVSSATFSIGEPLIIAACVYFCLTFPTSKIIAHFERKMSRGDKR